MNERIVQDCIFALFRPSYETLLPNYTPRNWFECDVFGVTKAGYFHEFEIKRTLSDFRADAHKACRHLQRVNGRWTHVESPQTKHEKLACRSADGPCQFWYVLPAGLVPECDVPEWAGLREFNPKIQQAYCGAIKTVRKAPSLHRQKIDAKIVEHARGVCYWRFWTERRNYSDYMRRQPTSAPPSSPATLE